jgi:hypothetical protein
MTASLGWRDFVRIVLAGRIGLPDQAKRFQNDYVDFFNNRTVLFALSFYGLPFFIAFVGPTD